MRRSTILSTAELEGLARLAQTLRLARLRRNLSQAELADRMGVARASVVAMEAGRPGIAIGILLKALTVFGYTDRLGDLVAADPIGDDLDGALGRQRAGSRLHVADF